MNIALSICHNRKYDVTFVSYSVNDQFFADDLGFSYEGYKFNDMDQFLCEAVMYFLIRQLKGKHNETVVFSADYSNILNEFASGITPSSLFSFYKEDVYNDFMTILNNNNIVIQPLEYDKDRDLEFNLKQFINQYEIDNDLS